MAVLNHVSATSVSTCPRPDITPDGQIFNVFLVRNVTTETAGILDIRFGGAVGLMTVVAVGLPDTPGDQYRWRIDFECLEEKGEIKHIEFQFFSRFQRTDPAQEGHLLKSKWTWPAKLGVFDYVRSVHTQFGVNEFQAQR